MPRQTPRSNASRPARQRSGPNKQQVRAAAVRAAQTHEDVFAASTPFLDDVPTGDEPQIAIASTRQRSGVRAPAARGSGRSIRPVVTVRKLTREQEYSFIKADLRRLLLTAGSLALVMVVLLFIIEP